MGFIRKLFIYLIFSFFIYGFLFLFPWITPEALSQPSSMGIDRGDTAWMLTSTVLVLMMTIPGLFLFYSGLVRSKNALATIMHSFFIVALVSIQWVIIGYSLSFGPDINGIIGNLDWFALSGVGSEPNPDYAGNIPHYVFMGFQLTFAIITPALITGAFAERVKFSALILFTLIWTTLIYDPLAHWVWGGGWIGEMGALDFAGGTVVHISSGASALAAALMFGQRVGYGREAMAPHMLPFSIIGASLLWIGWFGFNAGSALAADGLAALAFINTNTSTGAAVITWALVEWLSRGKPTVLGPATGAVAGLVAITPAAGFVTPVSAIWIGIGAGLFCYAAISMKHKLGYDDSLDVVGVHGIGGTWGAIATGLFATTAVNVGGSNGFFAGNYEQLTIQIIATAATWAFTFCGSIIILTVLKFLIGLRVSIDYEFEGLDISEHGQVAYSGFQMIHGAGRSEIMALQEELQEYEQRRKKLMDMISRAGQQEDIIPESATRNEERPQRKENMPFKVTVQNMRKDELKRWWEEMCNMDSNLRPEDFNFIYQKVKKFDEPEIYFRAGNPEEVVPKIERLLEPFNASIYVESGDVET